MEAVKGGLGALVAYSAAALAAGTLTSAAVTPLFVMAMVAVGTGFILNSLDREYGIKEKVISALKVIPEQTAQGFYYIDTTAQSWPQALSDAFEKKKVEVGRAIDHGVKDWLCRIQCVRY